MKAKLVKEYGQFYLISDKEIQNGDEYVKLDNRPRTLFLGTTVASAKVAKLSFKNCQAIELGYDLDEVILEEFPYDFDIPLFETLGITEKVHKNILIGMLQGTLQKGFQKALEILGDKKFTFDQMVYIAGFAVGVSARSKSDPSVNIKQEILDLIDKLEQTEWEVEIIEEEPLVAKSRQIHGEFVASKIIESAIFPKPKLDAEGCLILKRL